LRGIVPVNYFFPFFTVSLSCRETPVRVWGICTSIWTGAVRLPAPATSLPGWQHGPLRVTLFPFKCISITDINFTSFCVAVRVYVGFVVLLNLCDVSALSCKGDWRACIRVYSTTRASRLTVDPCRRAESLPDWITTLYTRSFRGPGDRDLKTLGA
jgi:hypothetical protein